MERISKGQNSSLRLHTPGPWTIEGPTERSCKGKQFLFKCDMRSWHRIVDTDGSTVGFAPDIVTARQFAASPIMLEVLKKALLHAQLLGSGQESPYSDAEICEFTGAAIAKVEGKG